jgi:hypothetical protein
MPRAPLYARLAAGIAEDPDLAGLMLAAPPEQHNPTLLLCAVHDLVLRGDAPGLAAFYPNLTATPATGDPFQAFRAAALAHAGELREMLAVRRTQTNEIGRCAVLLPALALIAAEAGPLGTAAGPLAHVDVGASAGLNLLLDRYHYRYTPDPGAHRPYQSTTIEVGPPSTVLLTCGRRGAVPVPGAVPTIAASVGLDSRPIDVTDDSAVRWLEACVWPDQADRFDRLRAAIAIARDAPPTIRVGDAVDDVAATLDLVAGAGHAVLTTTWVLNYLSEDRQRAFVAELDAWGAGRDLSWISAESPAQTPGLPIPTTAEPEQLSVVALVTWRAGRRTVTRLGVSHPHGYWLHWAAPTVAASRPPW